ncbi:EAL domain-containing protein [Bacillus aerolatus]|uniref:EAL domain-containing protein n=1 Tax=Bacillus aerolatus TaxID=2653354 RepID=A0A6I1FMK8_9BACI|nr:EAL domain-containing protein [Bacillus aerolatus]KAB7707539.1 EAL domain-containing protein [Bacillus aerolatus]
MNSPRQSSTDNKTNALHQAEAFASLLTVMTPLNIKILNALPVNIFLEDRDGRTVFANKLACEKNGKPLDELVGKTVFDFFSPAVAEEIRRHDLETWEHKQLKIREAVADFQGKPTHMLTGTTIIQAEEEEYLLGFSFDISERVEAEEKMEQLAYYDPLTGLPNRSYVEHYGDSYLTADQQRLSALLVFDLDFFKKINDSLGHEAGDLLLQETASRLKTLETENILAARVSGDEFALLFSGVVHESEVLALCEKVVDLFQKPFTVLDKKVSISASIGVSIYPQHGENMRSLFINADIAVHDLKRKGRNGCQFFAASMKEAAHQRLETEILLSQGLEKEEFILHYQPKVHISTGKVYGMEALVRWNSENGLVYPGDFIELAEETELIIPLGEWVLREACRQCKEWHELGHTHLKVSVNVSAVQFQKQNFAELTACILAETGLQPDALELELTESAVMEQPEEAAAILSRLQQLGVCISIDDFGTGFSSFSYLKRFPMNVLKIDRSFIENIEEEKADAAIAKAMISLARNLDLMIVAEGVENKKQMDILKEADCDAAQGFFLSHPLDADAFLDYLESNK